MKKLLQIAIVALSLSSCTVNHYHYTLPNEVIVTTSKPLENPYNYVPSILNETGKPFSYTPPSSTSSPSNTDVSSYSTTPSTSSTPSTTSSSYTPSSSSSSNRTIYTGPRGGKYYYNSNGNKTYVRKK